MDTHAPYRGHMGKNKANDGPYHWTALVYRPYVKSGRAYSWLLLGMKENGHCPVSGCVHPLAASESSKWTFTVGSHNTQQIVHIVLVVDVNTFSRLQLQWVPLFSSHVQISPRQYYVVLLL